MLDNVNSRSPLNVVSVTKISPTAWQVRSRSRSGSEAPVLLGLIQQLGHVFEVMDVMRPLERTYVPTLASAVASVTGGTVTQ